MNLLKYLEETLSFINCKKRRRISRERLEKEDKPLANVELFSFSLVTKDTLQTMGAAFLMYYFR